jgi:AcrR family transcriptional regulator
VLFYFFCYTPASMTPASVNPPARRKAQSRGERTRDAILERAVQIASVSGLEGLTLGVLAEELGMSKSGLFAHFESKEDLQLATIDAARHIFIAKVVVPALCEPKGLPRLWKLLDLWVGHVEKRVFSGGCFFTAASFEFDSRKGAVRDRIAGVMREWIDALTRAVREAKQTGHLSSKSDPARLAYEMHALAVGSHLASQLLDDRAAYRRARSSMLEKLRSLATTKAPRIS